MGILTTHPDSDSRPHLRWWARVALGVVVVILGVAAVAYWQWEHVPAHWERNQRFLAESEPEQVNRLAESLEARLSRRLSPQLPPVVNGSGARRQTNPAGREDSTSPHDAVAEQDVAASQDPEALEEQDVALPPNARRLVLGVQEVNAWLAVRLPKYLLNQGIKLPDGVSDPMVTVNQGQLVATVKIDTPQLKQVVSLYFEARVTEDEKLFVKLNEVRGGRLPLPARFIIEKLRAAQKPGPQLRALDWIAQSLDGQTINPVLGPDKSGTSYEILEIDVEPDSVAVTVNVEQDHPASE